MAWSVPVRAAVRAHRVPVTPEGSRSRRSARAGARDVRRGVPLPHLPGAARGGPPHQVRPRLLLALPPGPPPPPRCFQSGSDRG